MSTKKRTLTITPWMCRSEWLTVKEHVLARDARALKYLQVWAARVPRLPAGVETTCSLLTAFNSRPHTSLSLATAVNRFLNHISHLAMNMWGLTKLHQAGARLAVPEWLVELRHEVTHGHMPNTTLLLAAVQFGLSWLDHHYWGYEGREEFTVEEDNQQGELEKLLECYMYLKLYQLWGTDKMSELQGQQDVWNHLKELWGVVKSKHVLKDLSVKQAVGVIKTEVFNLCDGDEGAEVLADVLTKADLLVPETDFLESLDSEDKNDPIKEVKVPFNLILIWVDFIHLIDKGMGVKILIEKLLEKLKEKEEENEMCAAWIVILAEGLLGIKHKILNVAKDRIDLSTLYKWLDRPNRMSSTLCGLFCELAEIQISDPKRSKIEQLVKLCVGDKIDCQGELGGEVYTEKHLTLKNPEEISEEKHVNWELATDYNWDLVKLGEWENQSWDMLWVEGEWKEAEKDKAEEDIEFIPSFEIGSIDWASAKGAPRTTSLDSTPHFYSNRISRGSDNSRGYNQRKRKMKE